MYCKLKIVNGFWCFFTFSWVVAGWLVDDDFQEHVHYFQEPICLSNHDFADGDGGVGAGIMMVMIMLMMMMIMLMMMMMIASESQCDFDDCWY